MALAQGMKSERSLAAVFPLYKSFFFAGWLSYFIRKAFFVEKTF